MDPQSALENFWRAFNASLALDPDNDMVEINHELEQARDSAAALFGWLGSDGHPPDWKTDPDDFKSETVGSVADRLTDKQAMNAIAGYINAPGDVGGADLCQFIEDVMRQTQRPVLDDEGDPT